MPGFSSVESLRPVWGADAVLANWKPAGKLGHGADDAAVLGFVVAVTLAAFRGSSGLASGIFDAPVAVVRMFRPVVQLDDASGSRSGVSL